MGACFNGHAEVANLLISRGAAIEAVNGNGGTALMFAAMFQRLEIIDALLAAGANKSIRDFRGLSALDHASQQRNMEAIAKLN